MKINQSGRSMIEMLGVLAIIGVLSVGGIAGYSKAMLKFRVNKTVDQVTQIATNVRTFFGSQSSYEALSCEVLYKAHLVPDEMREAGKDCTTPDAVFSNAFGGKVTVAKKIKLEANDDKAFMITVANVPEEACLELAVLDWGASSGSGLVAFGTADVSNQKVGDDSSDDKIATPYSSTRGIPMSPSKAVNACQNGDNTLYWKFY